MSHYAPWVILLAPLLSALLTALPVRWFGPRIYGIGVLLQFAAFIVAARTLHLLGTRAQAAIPLDLPSLHGRISVGLSIDRVAGVMGVVITGIGTLIYLYSVRY